MMTVQEVRAVLQQADEREFAALERSLAADTRKGVIQALETARRRIEGIRAEHERVEGMYAFERGLLPEGGSVIVGLDEVGRGAVAGPLAVGAVVFSEGAFVEGLNDSKQLKPERREELSREIEDACEAWAVEYIAPEIIDAKGIAQALRMAFAGAIAQIEDKGIVPDVVLIDGNPLNIDKREVNVVKGDAKCASIAAASIVAKVHRDALMCNLAGRYPGYAFDVNKGYGSPHHIEAIRTQGLSDVHRASFCRSFMQETLF